MEKKKTGRTGIPPHAVIVNGIVFPVRFVAGLPTPT